MKIKIVIIGSGNLAFHLTPAIINKKDIEILGIYSRNKDSGIALGKNYQIPVLNSFEEIPKETNLVLLWISDDAIGTVSKKLNKYLNPDTIIAHSSGTKSLSEIDSYFTLKGCIWPLQTFSKNDQSLNLNIVPFFICASDKKTLYKISSLTKLFSPIVHPVDNETKLKLHLAAVLANNFVNHLMGQSIEIVENSGFDRNILSPILEKTIKNVLESGAVDSQTGPAVRKDYETMAEHIRFVDKDKYLKQIYIALSESIIKKTGK